MRQANNTSVKVRKAETCPFKHLTLKRVSSQSQKLLLSGLIRKRPRMDIWVTLSTAAFKSKKKILCQNSHRKTIKKIRFHLIHLSSIKKYPNRPKFIKRKYKSRKASKAFKICCVKTISSKMISHQINFPSIICSAFQINHLLKAITLTVSLIGTSSICVIYFSY